MGVPGLLKGSCVAPSQALGRAWVAGGLSCFGTVWILLVRARAETHLAVLHQAEQAVDWRTGWVVVLARAGASSCVWP